MPHLSTRLRKALLTVHVLCSVGWFGVVFLSLALGLAAEANDDAAWSCRPTW